MARTYYISCDRYALPYFMRCHGRVTIGKCPSIQWPRNRKGYLHFCAEIGPIPKSLKKPSVGRIDHKKGYCEGNIRWEEHSVNSIKRRGTRHENSAETEIEFYQPSFRKGTAAYFEHQRKATNKRWSDPNERYKMSIRMTGNSHANGNKGNRR